MNTWFECKVTYEKTNENGLLSKTTESYLIDTVSYTHVEAKLTEELAPFTANGIFTINTIKRVKIAELFLNDKEEDDKYFRCKVNLISLDEKKGVEKKTAATMIVKSSSLPHAVERLDKEMSSTLFEYEIASVVETNIMDIYQA